MAILELRPNCECCDRDLPPDSVEAYICTFECTFCQDCTTGVLDGHCPNCLGNLTPRPVRPLGGPVGGLAKYPAATQRVLKEGGCNATPIRAWPTRRPDMPERRGAWMVQAAPTVPP